MNTTNGKPLRRSGLIDARTFPTAPFVERISPALPIMEYINNTMRLVLRPSAKAAARPSTTSSDKDFLGAGDNDNTSVIVLSAADVLFNKNLMAQAI